MRMKLIGAVGIAIGLVLPAHAQTRYVAMALKVDSAITYGCSVDALSDNGLSAGICLDGVRQIPSMWDARGNQTVLPVPGNAPLVWVTGINSAGRVTAYFIDGSDVMRAVRWDDGQPTILGPGAYSAAYGVNDAGDVVGTIDGFATIWKSDGKVVKLTSPDVPGLDSPYATGLAINAFGVVAGSAAYAAYPSFNTAVLWQRGTPTLLTPNPQSNPSTAMALNARGTAVGYVIPNNGNAISAQLWKSTQTVTLPGLPGSMWTIATGINRSETVVGYSVGENLILHGTTWEDGVVARLDTVTSGLPVPGGSISIASAINNRGWIGARYGTTSPPYTYPVILKPVR